MALVFQSLFGHLGELEVFDILEIDIVDSVVTFYEEDLVELANQRSTLRCNLFQFFLCFSEEKVTAFDQLF